MATISDSSSKPFAQRPEVRVPCLVIAPLVVAPLVVALFVVALFVVALFVVALFVTVAFPAGSVVAAPCWLPAVFGSVTDGYREPPCPYCAGNRGLEYRVGTDAPVRAVAAGTVTYAGTLAGTRYVVVQHANGWRATYGKLTSSMLARGDRVLARSRIGRASREFYFGLRIGERYIDPAPYLGRLVGRPRLVPIDGTPARRPPTPRLRCSESPSGP